MISPLSAEAALITAREILGGLRLQLHSDKTRVACLRECQEGFDFLTGNAAAKFRQADQYVERRLRVLMIKKRGRNLRAGQAKQRTRQGFHGQGIYCLGGTARHPVAA
ncbi:hypothetical protein ACFCVY_02355 [Streptomyces sp. NPDC056411]|uniref:hypothetical protein n=1 Tax=Streptomyces sp. NPDC056411 TaxID=3345813 RepID=UPI0035DFD559